MKPLGDYIGGAFREPHGAPLLSRNPARDGQVVLETAWSAERAKAACEAARDAQPAWARLPRAQRWEALVRFREAISARADALADAVVAETGKLRTEARGEVSALIARFDLVRKLADADLREGPLAGHPSEQLRFHPLGVVGVLGPFNYPLHLCHAYVVPALLTGNAVVVKPSEVAPLSGQCYAEAAHAAGLPPGVLNVVQGGAEAGQALVAHPAVRGLCFTGSYQVGRAIREQALDRPELLLALEMGGKNTVVVLDDANLRQAAHEIAVGGYLTTGQRCTATDRVLVHRDVADKLVEVLRPLVEAIRFGDPEDPHSFAGPLATEPSRERFETAQAAARAGGAEPIIAGGRDPGGYFVRPALHRLPVGKHDIAGYTDTELFGPDVHIEVVGDDDEAIATVQHSPYGFANAVFTADQGRFERFYQSTQAGILNRNRSTNMASPRLPFGGVGRSGNHRPAGSYALRNAVIPTAVQENVIGAVNAHAHLAAHLPGPDLDQLAARHLAEEREEGTRRLIDLPRVLSRRQPPGGRMPQSQAWLDRLYAGDRVVRERKPAVFDHLRSSGPWFVSVDDEPLAVLDGMSQTATMPGGFAEDSVVCGFIEGAFGDTLVTGADTSSGRHPSVAALATALQQAVPGMRYVTFANSGAEANEKALALCRQNAANPSAKTVLAFEGSFHGRTLLSLHTTYNPVKRGPFEVAGYEAVFAPYPLWHDPYGEQPVAPAGFYAAAASGDLAGLAAIGAGVGAADPLLNAEIDSLAHVDRALASGRCFACIIEPMQCEGGDRYATDRFFRALRLLTRHHHIALIMDEVQTGFGLGGPFAWHTQLGLIDSRGRPDVPDAVTFAKRAQVGVVMSQFEDPEPTPTSAGSLVRGRLHAVRMAANSRAHQQQESVRRRLHAIAAAYPHLVGSPRGRGCAFAFDLPSPAHLAAYLGQRFWRGAIVYGAGTRTVRYRLSEAYYEPEIDTLFETIRRSLSWLDAHPNETPPAWHDTAPAPATPAAAAPLTFRVRTLSGADARAAMQDMLDLEAAIYEPARQASVAELTAAIDDPDGVTNIAEAADGDGWRFVGFALALPMERVATVEGPDRDPMRPLSNTLYSLSITVAAECQGRGVGRALKVAQAEVAARMKRPDGSPRYRYLCGRNRVGLTAGMTRLNRIFGAHEIEVLSGQYRDPEAQALYYRLPLGPLRPDPDLASDAAAKADGDESKTLEGSSGICRPLANPPESLQAALDSGLLYGPAVNKITLMNFTTPQVVRAMEWTGALMPALPHMYMTSCRDECVDKALRILRWHREQAQVAIGLEGGYVGHTTAAARSISDPAVHAQGQPHFDWPRVPHPANAGVDASVAALRQAIAAAGGPERVFGIFIEPLQERTGRVIPAPFWTALAALRDELDVPVVAVETASASYRTGAGPFALSDSPFVPDLMHWWGGAQTGYMHVSRRYWVSKPLTMVSTWDGDELSVVRQHHELRALRERDLSAAIGALDEALAALADKQLSAHGVGLYRVIDAGGRAQEIVDACRERGLHVRAFANQHLAIAPAFDEAEAVAAVLKQVSEVL